MECLGVFFSLSEEEAQRLLNFELDCEVLDYVQNVIEEDYFNNHPTRMAECDKAWDAMQRALGDSSLYGDSRDYPLNYVIFGGTNLCSDATHILYLKAPDHVRDIASALAALDEAAFRKRYNAIDAKEYGCPLSEEDFKYTWSWLQEVREFYLHAAAEGRYVLLTADQ